MSTRLGVDAANTAANAVAARLANGYVRVYTGAPPANADDAITNQVLLAEAQFGATAFGAAAGGEIQANAIAEITCLATGTATWFQALRSDGATVEFDGAVGIVDAEMIVSSTNFNINQPLQLTSLTFRFPLS